ncbi:MAG TPA: ribbon-helix-helix domain-containing protein [Longimicrobiales bacterium]
MPRKGRVKKSQLGTYIPESLHEAIREFSDESGISIARIVEDALRMYLRAKGRDDEPGWLARFNLPAEEVEDLD